MTALLIATLALASAEPVCWVFVEASDSIEATALTCEPICRPQPGGPMYGAWLAECADTEPAE